MPRHSTLCLSISIVAVTILLVVLTTLNATRILYIWRQSADASYSYVGDDWPKFWTQKQHREVAMIMEDTAHFSIVGIDATDEWASTTPKGQGYLRLGPEHRDYALSMTHEQHCLRLIRSTLSGNQNPVTRAHVQYCLNYIRQMVLCSPDLTLEPANILHRQHETERVHSTHVCRDWRVIYEQLEENWDHWVVARGPESA